LIEAPLTMACCTSFISPYIAYSLRSSLTFVVCDEADIDAKEEAIISVPRTAVTVLG
jgi:hypothetical protein